MTDSTIAPATKPERGFNVNGLFRLEAFPAAVIIRFPRTFDGEEALAAVRKLQTENVIFDVSQVARIKDTFPLICAVRRQHFSLALMNVSADQAEALRVTRLDSVIPVYKSEEECRRALHIDDDSYSPARTRELGSRLSEPAHRVVERCMRGEIHSTFDDQPHYLDPAIERALILDVNPADGRDIAKVNCRRLPEEGRAFEQFRAELQAASKESARLLLDLQGLEFLGSTAVGAIIRTARELHQRGGILEMCGAEAPVRELLNIIKITVLIPLYESREEALRQKR